MTPAISHATPIVFVVDDDISVRESLELLFRCEGWQPERSPRLKNSSPGLDLLFQAV